jgi:hypothetical protein
LNRPARGQSRGQDPQRQRLDVLGLVIAVDGEQYLPVGEDGSSPDGRVIVGEET